MKFVMKILDTPLGKIGSINNASIEEFSRTVDNHVTHIMETKEQKSFSISSGNDMILSHVVTQHKK